MSMKSSTRGRLLATTVLGAVVVSAPAFAQETVTELVVTGSRIARPDLTSVSPLATVGAAELAAKGVVNTENLLNTLPQTAPGVTGTVNNGNGGVATVNLRGLGSTRTLVLVDGKRQVPTTSTGSVDINLIPPAMIDRIDVVTGGASAVYGSDAIAGVVNFILKRDFEGLEFRAGTSMTDEGDAKTYDVSATMGANIADGRGNMMLSLGYNKREPFFQGDSPQDKLHVSLGEPTGGAKAGTLIFSGSGSIEPGRVNPFVAGRFVTLPGVANNAANSALFLTDGNVRLYAGAPDTYNFAPVNYEQTPQERYSVTAVGRYKITDDIEATLKGNFVNSRVTTQLAPTPVGSRVFRFTLDNNPFLTAAAKQALNSLGSTTQYTIPSSSPWAAGTYTDVDTDGDGIFDTVTGVFNRRLTESGPRVSQFNFYGFQMQAGLTGKLGFINGQWETSFQYGNTHGSNSLLGDTSLQRIQQALLLNATGTACSDPSNGCVPINLFGQGNISKAAADFIATRINSSQDFEEIVAQAFISGDTENFFSLPAGPIGFAIGAEYRSDEFAFRPSQDLAVGNLTGFNASPPVSGYIDVYELSGEARVPLLKDLPLVKELNLELAGRLSDYSSQSKTTKTYKVAGDWEVYDDLRLRASYNRAVRAPSVGELFGPRGNSFPTATDPCSAQGNPNAAVRQACINSGVAANLVGVIQANQQTQTISGGNPNLEPEKADTYTAGFVYQPHYVPNLSVTVDFFDIKIKDYIAAFGGSTANVLNVCYKNATVNGNPNSPYCSAVNRLANGSIDFVSLQLRNVAKQANQGLDVSVSYRFDMQDVPGLPDWGSFSVRTLYTNTWKNIFYPDAISQPVKCADRFGPNCNGGGTGITPRHKLHTTIGWKYGDWGATLVWDHLDDVTDDNNSTVYTVERIGAKNYLDLSVDWAATENVAFTAGVRNLTQESYPVLGGNASPSNSGYPNTYDVLGRVFFANVRLRY
ncbi:MAG: TonB-dependent receptor [Phenylobacterium sp.]|uniref:TonB-dependent receptor domain-containing protein n=1 Tax=Phenylobacterium sp. TaxID=1871053 RepID=UPI0025DEC6F7|nr:TonB-dependent receptor [Phenylobacterium sp.]MBI1197061.1 TonB-dependent receptor [Phenylobacterium sp.]